MVFLIDNLSNRRLRKLGEGLFFLLTLHNRVPHQINYVRVNMSLQNQNPRDPALDCLF
jgi:hypothetical protein